MNEPQFTPGQVTIALLQLAHAVDVLSKAPERSILDATFDSPAGRSHDGHEMLQIIEHEMAQLTARLHCHRGRARWGLRR